MLSKEILTVSRYLDTVNAGLKSAKARILGEVFGIQDYPGRSYMYYSIKDTKDGSTVKCFMWKNDYKVSGVVLKEGLEVILTAYPAVYKPNGSLSLQVLAVELVGEGALQIAYEKLKQKLAEEGLFDVDRKRQIPTYPQKIGVVTSKSGAVINDFLTNIGKFGFQIKFVDSKVEGADATRDLLQALEVLKKEDIDVLVIMRGGGSLESFQAFNNEVLVRAVGKFPVPVITGIGHDKDAPLVSFVSDKNVSTPTAVANLLSSGWDSAGSHIRLAEEKIYSSYTSLLQDKNYLLDRARDVMEEAFRNIFEAFRQSENSLSKAVSSIGFAITEMYRTLDRHKETIKKDFVKVVYNVDTKLDQMYKYIEQASPERQLKLGYSIVRSGKRIIKSIKTVKKDDDLEVVVSDGIIVTRVK